MRGLLTIPVLLSLFLLAIAVAFGAPFADPGTVTGLLMAQVAAGAVQVSPFRRIREDLPSFQNVVASGRASTLIPDYPLTLVSVDLKLGGTTFTKANITEVKLRKGAHVIWFATGSHLQKINDYRSLFRKVFNRATFLRIDFTQPMMKGRAEFIGGIDMSKLGAGDLWLEVLTSGATAPTLAAKATWLPPQDNSLIQKMLQFSYAAGVTGRQKIPLDFAGAQVLRCYFIYGGTDWSSTATSAAWATNTGNGVMGAITVSAGAKIGVYKLAVIEPGANVGTFIVEDPDGMIVSVKGTVASAFSGGGLAFTLADGGTDFVSGDGFDITVADNSDGNMNRLEVKRNGRVVWDYTCSESRYLQQTYGHNPQQQMYVADFTVDNHPDALLLTDGLVEWNAYFTATDAVTIYAEILDEPDNN